MKRLGIILIFLCFIPASLASIPYFPGAYSNPPPAAARAHHESNLFMRYIMQHPCPPRTRSRRTRALPLPPPCMPRKIDLNRTLPCNVNAVFIQGAIDLTIKGNSSVNKIMLNCPYQDLTIKVCNNAVYISNTNPGSFRQKGPRPKITVCLNQLNQLVVAGDSCVCGYNLNTCCGLELENCGCGTINLEGTVHLVRVTNSGSALICIPHVITDHLHILATRSGVIHLRGSTRLLLVRAFQNAYVDTRFLCSETAMVQATDKSLVTLKTTGSLQAFASGMSNVYYYVKPGDFYEHAIISGNVFQMGDGW